MTAERAASETYASAFKTRDTVPRETPATAATSLMVARAAAARRAVICPLYWAESLLGATDRVLRN